MIKHLAGDEAICPLCERDLEKHRNFAHMWECKPCGYLYYMAKKKMT